MKVWARLGADIEVNEEEFKDNPEQALINAVERGDYIFNGDCYVPDECSPDGYEIGFEIK